MMTKLHPTEPIATFKFSIPSAQADRFFDAVAWQQATRPPAAPTLATVFRQGEFLALQQLKIPLQKILHGEQRYRFHRDLAPELQYEGATFLNSQYEKSGGSGSMTFYTFQTNLVDGTGQLCVECHTTIVVRG